MQVVDVAEDGDLIVGNRADRRTGAGPEHRHEQRAVVDKPALGVDDWQAVAEVGTEDLSTLMHLALKRIHAIGRNGGIGRERRQHLAADDEVPGLAGNIRTDHPRHGPQRVARDHRIAPVAVQIEIDREKTLCGRGTQRVEYLRVRLALPHDVPQH